MRGLHVVWCDWKARSGTTVGSTLKSFLDTGLCRNLPVQEGHGYMLYGHFSMALL